jgi:hypothetical protein
MNKEEVKGAIESLLQDENIKNGAYSFIGETNICYADIHILLKQLQAYKDREDKLNSSKLIEVLADIEHKRWSGWQEYLHSLCVKNEDGSLTIPKERVDWWNKEIETPYCELEERLKEYDRDEVKKTLSAISQILNKEER